MLGLRCLCFVIIISFITNCKAYRIPQGTPLPVLRNTPIVYRGPVFVVQETTNASEPFIGQIVEGGIEMVQPVAKIVNKLPLGMPTVPFNDSHREIQDDPEYFAVLVTPETVAQAQIPRTTSITVPLPMLLLGVSSRIPWVMVLRRENHYNYLRNPTPLHLPNSQRRRTKSLDEPGARLFTESRKYDLIYTEDDKNTLHTICTNVIQELVYLNSLLHRYGNESEMHDMEQFDFVPDKNASRSKNDTKDDDNSFDDVIPIEKFLDKLSSSNKTQKSDASDNANKKKIIYR